MDQTTQLGKRKATYTKQLDFLVNNSSLPIW